MRFGPLVLTVAALCVTIVSFAVLGCSDDKSDYPTGGGTGGGSLFDSGTLNAPATFDHTFPTAGTVGYFCRFHRSMGMTGTVTVVAGGADAADVTASGMAFTPASVSIKPGGVVHWHVTGGQHTVTSN
jgi:plastocyanin